MTMTNDASKFHKPDNSDDTFSALQGDSATANGNTERVIQDFDIYLWLALLSAVGFSGATFGIGGWGLSIAIFIIAVVLNFVTLNLAFGARDEKNALKQLSDGAAVVGLALLFILMFIYDLVAGLVGMLFFLQMALNFLFREHRQVYFGLLVAFVALMTGAVYTYESSYLIFILLFCLFSCFYMAQVFVDKQRYHYLDTLADTPNTSHSFKQQASDQQAFNQQAFNQQASDQQATVASSPVQYIGHWHHKKRIVLAVLISLIAGFIYLITPHFPAGNLGKSPLKGFGQYENIGLEEQVLPEGSDLSKMFYSPPESENQGNKGAKGNKANKGNGQQGSAQAGRRDLDAQGQANSPKNENQVAMSAPSTSQSNEMGIPTQSATSLDDSILYYVKSSRNRYLQVETQTYFDGRSWQSLHYGWKKLTGDYYDYDLYDVQANNSIDVTVAKDSNKDLLSTYNTVAIEFANSWVATNYYDQLKVSTPLKKDTQYQLKVFDEFNHNRLVDSYQAIPDKKDLQLPNHLDPRIAGLGKHLTKDLVTDWEKAAALETYLRTSYEYTLDTLAQQNNIPLADFLFESKRGHCEYFATAMAVLLRQQGIPTRMITGYAVNDYNPITGFYEVKGTNGHAWVNAYVDGNWVLYEATGAYPTPTRYPNNNETREASNAQDSTTQSTYNSLKQYLEDLTQQDERIKDAEVELSLFEKIKTWIHLFWYGLVTGFAMLVAFIKRIAWLVGLGVMVTVVTLLLYRRYHNRIKDHIDLYRLKRLDITHDKQSLLTAIWLYQRMLQRNGLTRLQGRTIENFTAQLKGLHLITDAQADTLIYTINASFYDVINENKTPSNNRSKHLNESPDLTDFFIDLYQYSLKQYQQSG